MKKLIVFFFLAAGLIWAGEDAAKQFDFVGAAKCKMCHKSDKKGNQWKVWEDSKHAGALETLKSDKAAEIATKMGLKVPAFGAPECLPCHTTGYGKGGFEVKDAKFWAEVTDKGKPTKDVKRMTALAGVGCESCHGAGDGYKSKKTMTSLLLDEIDAASVGYLTVDENTCKSCHNEKSPTYDKEKPFVFKDRVKKIGHPYPAEKKAEIIAKLKSK